LKWIEDIDFIQLKQSMASSYSILYITKQHAFNLILPRNLIFGSEQVLRFCGK